MPTAAIPAIRSASPAICGIGEKPLMLDGMPLGRPVQTAFEIGEDEIGLAQFRPDQPERHGRVVDIHQIHVAEQDQRGHPAFSGDFPSGISLGRFAACYDTPMAFEWDEAKRLANIQKHGIDFADVEQVFAGMFVETEDLRRDYGEKRFRAVGDWATISFNRIHVARTAVAGSSAPEGQDEMTEERITRVTLERGP